MADNPEKDAASLESEFSHAELKILQSKEGLSASMIAKLETGTAHQVMANFGEPWNSTDVRSATLPNYRLLFVGKTDSIVAIVFQSGGIAGPRVTMMLSYINEPWYCFYGLSNQFTLMINMEEIQRLFLHKEEYSTSCRIGELPAK